MSYHGNKFAGTDGQTDKQTKVQNNTSYHFVMEVIKPYFFIPHYYAKFHENWSIIFSVIDVRVVLLYQPDKSSDKSERITSYQAMVRVYKNFFWTDDWI